MRGRRAGWIPLRLLPRSPQGRRAGWTPRGLFLRSPQGRRAGWTPRGLFLRSPQGRRAGWTPRRLFLRSPQGRRGRLDASEAVAQVAPILPNSQLLQYRAAVDDLVTEAGGAWGPPVRSPPRRLSSSALDNLSSRLFFRASPEVWMPSRRAWLVRLATTGLVSAARRATCPRSSGYSCFLRSTRPGGAGRLLSFPTPMCCARPNWWISRRSGRPRCCSSSTEASRPGCRAGLGTGRSGGRYRQSVRARRDCGSHVRGRRSSQSSTRSLASSPRLFRHVPPVFG